MVADWKVEGEKARASTTRRRTPPSKGRTRATIGRDIWLEFRSKIHFLLCFALQIWGVFTVFTTESLISDSGCGIHWTFGQQLKVKKHICSGVDVTPNVLMFIQFLIFTTERLLNACIQKRWHSICSAFEPALPVYRSQMQGIWMKALFRLLWKESLDVQREMEAGFFRILI